MQYEVPELEVIAFANEDIIATSDTTGGDTGWDD